jgi:hypothetical protein
MKTAMPQFLITILIVCLASVQNARALSPPPDGGYPGNNTAEGQSALLGLTTGINDTAVGWFSLKSNTDGQLNTAVGSATLFSTVHASRNTAIGGAALFSDTDGFNNTAVGALALFYNTTGYLNTAIGDSALLSNTIGRQNTAVGDLALTLNTNGNDNTAVGYSALVSNTVGFANTAIGDSSLGNNTTGNTNTAIGSDALPGNTTGDSNTATGFFALYSNGTGGQNTAVGESALSLNQSGIVNIALGFHAGDLTTGDNNIVIGNRGVEGESNTIRIGGGVFGYGPQTAAFISGISGTAVVGDAVVADGNGQLGTVASSARFKKNIKPMDKTSEAILALKPVSFQYRSDSKGTPQFGLIAEEVAKVNPDLIVRNRDGEIYSVRYEAVNAMLLNEFLKEHRKVQELETNAAKQQKQIEALTAGLQKVTAQLEVSKAAPRTVLNNP